MSDLLAVNDVCIIASSKLFGTVGLWDWMKQPSLTLLSHPHGLCILIKPCEFPPTEVRADAHLLSAGDAALGG